MRKRMGDPKSIVIHKVRMSFNKAAGWRGLRTTGAWFADAPGINGYRRETEVSRRDLRVTAPTEILHRRPHHFTIDSSWKPDRTVIAEIVVKGLTAPRLVDHGNTEVGVQITDVDGVKSFIVECPVRIIGRRDLTGSCTCNEHENEHGNRQTHRCEHDPILTI